MLAEKIRKVSVMPVRNAIVLSMALIGCASTATKAPSSNDSESVQNQIVELRLLLTTLTNKVEELEGKLSAVNGKIETSQSSTRVPEPVAPKPTTVGIQPHPSERSGSNVSIPPSPHDPEAGFVNDEAVQSYRKAMILLQARKFSEAVLAFSSFLEEYPDHALAGSAQFHVGESYFRQKEYKLSLQEFKRVLTSYDRSTHVADTLRLMADAEDALNMREDAARHRQQLRSLFPQSPAASFSANAASTLRDPAVSGKSILDEPPPPTAPLGSGSNLNQEHKTTE
ncbi:MAG: hypothetical protein A2603_03380 [Bdellovibrionales bacterium RIFOXYD1_FULL_55_31]|nr:MAG: hypothetical protein A2603_03380 [Bdellovibrionales bacterium RIFOXYD1_FULL_55_31]